MKIKFFFFFGDQMKIKLDAIEVDSVIFHKI